MIRAPIPDLSGGERTLRGPVGHYLARVLRVRSGQAFVAFDPVAGVESDAVVLGIDADAVTARFDPPRPGRALPWRPLVWVQGFAKGDKCDAVVRDATELGATRIVVASTRRSVVKLDASRGASRQARWERIAREAARQCARSEAPVVEPPMAWTDALAFADASHARFCLWENANEPLAPALFEALADARGLAFACGPEGGLEEAEVDAARADGWVAVSLGPLTLRTETVAAAVLGAVRVWSGLSSANAL